VGLRSEFSSIFALSLSLFELSLDQHDQELFGFDLGDLDVTVGISVQKELLADGNGEESEKFSRLRGEALADEINKVVDVGRLVFSVGEDFVDFLDEDVGFSDEFDEAFGDQDDTEVSLVSGSFADQIGDIVNNLVERDFLLLDFFTDDGQVGTGEESALQSDVGGRSAHKSDEMVVFLGGSGIQTDVTDQFGVGLAGSVKTEGDFDVLVLQITIDGLGAADNSDGAVVGLKVFGQQAGVGIGVITSDDDQTVQFKGLAVSQRALELFGSFNLVSSRA